MAYMPKTKAEFLNRLMAQDFSGNLHDLFPGGVTIKRVSDAIVEVAPKSTPAMVFQLVVRRPKSEAAKLKLREAYHKRIGKVTHRNREPKGKGRGTPQVTLQ